eukprot:m.111 g.111  ORF g.111 m.111 type:complete len:53 (+) comp577_c0_seq1:273-431(+)
MSQFPPTSDHESKRLLPTILKIDCISSKVQHLLRVVWYAYCDQGSGRLILNR